MSRRDTDESQKLLRSLSILLFTFKNKEKEEAFVYHPIISTLRSISKNKQEKQYISE
jgi:hypothetical protein